MPSNIVRLSKPERLKIKKKMSLLMHTAFKIKYDSSPSIKQYHDSRTNRSYIIPYPYGIIRFSEHRFRRFPNSTENYCGIPKGRMKNFHISCNLNGLFYSEEHYLPVSVKAFSLKPDYERKYTLGNIRLKIDNDSCSLSTCLVPPNTSPDDYYRMHVYRSLKITLRYKPGNKELSIKTAINRNDYDVEVMNEIVKLMLYSLISY